MQTDHTVAPLAAELVRGMAVLASGSTNDKLVGYAEVLNNLVPIYCYARV